MVQTLGFSVFLIRAQFRDFKSALVDPSKLTAHPLKNRFGVTGEIFLGAQRSVPPRWLEFINEGATAPIVNLFNSSTRAVVFVKTTKGIFAWIFGFGRFLLKEESYEKDFGFKVTLNSVDPDRLKSVDKAEIQEIVKQTRTQISRASSMASFGVDPAQDLMRAVAGHTLTFPFTHILSGEEALHFSGKLTFKDLPRVSDQFFNAYKSHNYRANFKWVDNMQPVRDKTRIDKLNAQLVSDLAAGRTSKAHLAPPELFDWDHHDGFAFSHSKDAVFEDLSLDSYLGSLRQQGSLTLDKLKKDHILVHNTETSEFAREWSIYRALVYEFSQGGKNYVLALGRWYAIEASFVKRAKNYVRSIPNYSSRLPSCRRKESEGANNKRVQRTQPTKFVLLDKENLRPDNANWPIEPCDLLSSSKAFIHVKKRHSSSTLSHLFAQGRVSAAALLGDASFRTLLNAKIQKKTKNRSFLIPQAPTASHYTVVYAIITSSTEPLHDDLPFFSLVNMMQAVAQLRIYGVKVNKLKIAVS